MNEREFLGAIDCSFPYTDRAAAEALVAQSAEISANAIFGVAYELAFPPRGGQAPRARRHALLELCAAKATHPLAPTILAIVERLVAGEELSVDEALAAMRDVAEFPHQSSALAITYFAADDEDGVLDAEYTAIQARWGGA